jgi:phage tail-like protein
LGRFLLAFEKVLLGLRDPVPFPDLGDEVRYPERGLEETIAALSSYFDPKQIAKGGQPPPEDFLPWLAGWTALSLRADLTVAQQGDFIANAIRLYRRRGTEGNMEELLGIFTSQTVTVKDDLKEPHHFQVEISLAERDQDLIKRQQAIAHALIVLEKPAHTSYELIIYFPSMEIGKCRVLVFYQIQAAFLSCKSCA